MMMYSLMRTRRDVSAYAASVYVVFAYVMIDNVVSVYVVSVYDVSDKMYSIMM